MFGWLKKRPSSPIAPIKEREAILARQHPVFRIVDSGFHAYLEVLIGNPEWDDGQIEQTLCARGIASDLAHELVAFVPLAFGREIVEELGVKCSDVYRRHSIADGTECDLPLANELAYAWARAMIGLYRTAERNETFSVVATRSAELDAIGNALNGGTSKEQLRETTLAPPLIYFRQAGKA